MKLKSFKRRRAFSLLEISAVILIIGILVAGVMGGNILIAKSRLVAAVTLTSSSPISGIKDSALWLETAVDSSFPENQTTNNNSITTWYDARKSAANKVTITAAGSGPVYSNTINYIHAVKFDASSSSNHLQIADASFLNNTDYTIVILEKRQSNSANNYFFGESPTGTANQKLALGYSLDGAVIHAQGTNSYTSNVSSYANSTDKPKIFTFVSDSANGKKTYINGLLAAQSVDTTQLSGLGLNFPIGKGYTGEIGEIAIFTRPLKAEERKSVEDYMAKKFSMKINRDSVANGSCTTGTITPSGCSMDCSTASRAGISTPSTITDGQTTTATCGQTGYSGANVSLTCTSGSLSGSACGCDTGNNYTPSGGICVRQCNVSVAGSSVTTVTSGTTQVACDAGGHYGTTPFTFSACTGLPISGTCACATGYNGTNCNGCDTANNYVPSGGNCVPGCNVTASNGVTSPTTVVVGSSTLTCNDTGNGYSGNMGYTCASNGTFTINTPCTQSCTAAGVTPDTTSVPGSTIFKFINAGSYTFTCPTAKTASVLVVAGGGSGGYGRGGLGGGGGGGGGVVSSSSYQITASTPYSVVVGSGGIAPSSAQSNGGNGQNSTFGTMTAQGGGGGGGDAQSGSTYFGRNGGSGGGSSGSGGGSLIGYGTSTQTTQTNATNFYGNRGGGLPNAVDPYPAAGGGGASSVGSDPPGYVGGGGGGGTTSSIASGTSYSSYYFGAGGAGGSGYRLTSAVGVGGNNYGGNGASSATVATAGVSNSGGGGGGSNGNSARPPAAGGSGIVIIRYPSN